MNYNLCAEAYSKLFNSNYNKVYKLYKDICKKDLDSKLYEKTYAIENAEQALAYLIYSNKHVDNYNIMNTSTPLNTNYKETGYKLYLSFNRKINLEQIPKSLSMLFPRLIFIPYKDDQYKIENLYHFTKTKHYKFPIKLCFIPYSNEFRVENISRNKDEFIQRQNDEYDGKILRSYEEAVKDNPLGIFSCELVGSEKLEKDMINTLVESESTFVNMPSYHMVDNANVINKLTVNYIQDGIYESYDLIKKTPYSNKEFIEKLTNENAQYVLVHIENIGRVLFCICKDYLTDEFRMLCENVLPDVVIVSAYTSDYSTFCDCSKEYIARNLTRIVLVGNACSAIDDSPLIAFQYHKTGDSRVERIDCRCENCKKCNEKDYCYFEIEIDEVDEKLSIKIVNKNGKAN